MRASTLILLFCASLSTNAQLDSVGVWKFGLSGAAIFSGQYGTVASSPYLGVGFGAFTRYEQNVCTHYQIELMYEKSGFEQLGNENPLLRTSIFYLDYLKLQAERGSHLLPYLRFQYGIHLKYLMSFDDGKNEFLQKDELSPLDIGVNVGVFAYPAKGLSIGLRYSQGVINTFQVEKYSRTTSGLNWSLMAQLYVSVF